MRPDADSTRTCYAALEKLLSLFRGLEVFLRSAFVRFSIVSFIKNNADNVCVS